MRRLILFSMVLATSLAPLQAATLERLTIDDLIVKSTAIVRGKVSGSYTAFRGPVIYTHYAVQVTEQLKGSPQTSVEVVVPGGTASQLRQIFPGAPQLKTGDEFVFFLWTGPSGLTQIMGLTQGLFALASTGTEAVATRAASAEVMLEPATGLRVRDQTLIMSLRDLRAQIAGRLRPRGAR